MIINALGMYAEGVFQKENSMSLLVFTAAVCGIFISLSSAYPVAYWAALSALAVLTAQAVLYRRQSRTDDLTSLYNLRQLETMKRRYKRCPELSVWYFDVNHLKRVNDTEGHSAGDSLLIKFASRLRCCTCRNTQAYRIGGDEFLLILPHSSGDNLPPLQDIHELPVSWGYATGHGWNLKELIVHAEREMYEKRRNGS